MIYDLTQTTNEDLPVYPGDPKVKLEPIGGVDETGFLDHLLTMDTHNGTHIDAPAHIIADGKELKDYPIERFVLKGICIDARGGFKPADIKRQVNEDGLAVLFCTGMSRYFYEEKYWQDYPVLDDSCMQALINKKVSLVGIDAGSLDNQDDFPVHKALLLADILPVENLTGLEPIIGKTFNLYALPLKLEKDGAPARVIATLNHL
ncbi:cyclase family protein [Candidatus Parcubacteria bacterium]|nr:cyclase family protein [Candidatus Parcubacteria bacterium]